MNRSLIDIPEPMPGMRGEDPEIADVHPGLPVILKSSFADPTLPRSEAVEAFLQKPFTVPELLAAVRRVIPRDRRFSE